MTQIKTSNLDLKVIENEIALLRAFLVNIKTGTSKQAFQFSMFCVNEESNDGFTIKPIKDKAEFAKDVIGEISKNIENTDEIDLQISCNEAYNMMFSLYKQKELERSEIIDSILKPKPVGQSKQQ